MGPRRKKALQVVCAGEGWYIGGKVCPGCNLPGYFARHCYYRCKADTCRKCFSSENYNGPSYQLACNKCLEEDLHGP